MPQTATGQTITVFPHQFTAPRRPKVGTLFYQKPANLIVVARGETTTRRVLELTESVSTPSVVPTATAQATVGLGVTMRHGRELADYILRLLPKDEQGLFLHEMLYAACEGLEKLDWWPVAEALNGWEATAEVEENPELADELDEAIAEYRTKHQGR